MDIEAANTAHLRKDAEAITKKTWHCPCSGCSKAVKQERQRIIDYINNIDLDAPYQLNALGFKLLVLDIINEGVKK